jgi:putative alpha-1,2-mannosidase
MGLFPNPGQDVYLITPPFFPSVSIRSPITDKTATIESENFDPGYKNIYIQNATLDGIPYTKNWIDHSFFTEGKRLVLKLGKEESAWGTRVEDLPPSLSEYVRAGNGSVNGTVGLKYRKRWFDSGAEELGLSGGVMGG